MSDYIGHDLTGTTVGIVKPQSFTFAGQTDFAQELDGFVR